jgi:tetratricopeptide (TPR) repeat protein
MRSFSARVATAVFLRVALAALLLAWCLREDVQPDLYFHLAAGRVMWESGSLPDQNVFLSVHGDHPFVDHEWLGQALAYPLFALGGAPLLTLLKTLLAAVCLAALASACARHGRVVRWAVLIPAVFLLGPRLVLRPEVLSFAGVALNLWLLQRDRFRPTRATLVALGAAQVVWSNAHGVSLLGPVVVALALGASLVHAALARAGKAGALPAPGDPRALAALLAVELGAALLNPYGPRASFYAALHVIHGSGVDLSKHVVELASPLAPGVRERWEVRLAVAWVLVAPALWLAALWRRRARLEDAAIGLGLVVLAVPYVRNLPLVALGLVVPTAAGLGALLSAIPPARADRARTLGAAAAGLVALLLARAVLADRLHENADHDARAGVGLGDFLVYEEAARVLAAPPRADMFNMFGSGHYFLWRGLRPFICGNVDLYPPEHLRRYHALKEGAAPWAAELDALGVRDVVLDHRVEVPAFFDAILADPRWALVHADDHAVVLRRAAPDVVARDRADLAREALSRTYADEAPDRFGPTRALRALRLLPERPARPISRLHMARLLERLGRVEEALVLARRAHDVAPDFAPAVLGLAELERAWGDPSRAERLYERATELVRGPTPWLGLGRVALMRAEVARELAVRARGAEAAARKDDAREAASVAQARAREALARAPGDPVAVQLLLTACELAEDPVELRRALASLPVRPAIARFHEGVAARLERDHARAEACYEEALALDPGLSLALAHLAAVRAERRDLPGAAAALERLVVATPRDPAAWRDLGNVRRALGRLAGEDGAIAAWRRAGDVDPREVDALLLAAEALAAERPPEARALVDEVLRRKPDQPDALRLRRELGPP